MKNITLITNIPSPYRDHLFKLLNNELKKKNKSFLVYFMSNTSKIRNWKLNNKKNYAFLISKGLKFGFGMHEFNFNYDIIKHVIINKKNSKFILGSSWNSPTIILLAFLIFVKVLKQENFYLWTETNERSFVIKNNSIMFLRRLIFSQFKKFIVPSKISINTLDSILNKKKNYSFHFMPNIVDENKFKNYCRSERNDNLIIGFCAARLHESSKGLLNFIDKSKPIFLKYSNFVFNIAGDGPDKVKIENYIFKHNLTKNINLLGHLTQDEMIKEYSKSDIFILPSLRDPCPLSIVEAVWMSMPLLISDRCGNIYEALQINQNGFSFDPSNASSILYALKSMLNLSKKERQCFGQNSLKIAKKNFSSKIVIKNIQTEILKDNIDYVSS